MKINVTRSLISSGRTLSSIAKYEISISRDSKGLAKVNVDKLERHHHTTKAICLDHFIWGHKNSNTGQMYIHNTACIHVICKGNNVASVFFFSSNIFLH